MASALVEKILGSPSSTEEGLSGDRWSKGRLQVHILLGFFTDKKVNTLHM